MPATTIEAVQSFPQDDYDGPNGYLYAFQYWLEDGTYGIAKHKTEAPRYNQGDAVEYEISRVFNGVNQLKFGSANGHGNAPRSPQRNSAPPATARSAGPAPKPPSPTAASSGGRFSEPTVLNAFSNASRLLSHGIETKLESETTAHAVFRVASQLLLVAETVQGGRLYKDGKTAQPAPRPSAAPKPPPPPPPTSERTSYEPGPDGSAFPEDDSEEDVPF